MKKILYLAFGLLAASPVIAGTILESDEGWNLSYSMGYQAGFSIQRGLYQQNLQPDQKAFLQGFHDRITAGEPALTSQKMESLLKALQQEQIALMQKASEANLEKGLAFLTANAKAQGVTELPSGLQYKVLTDGTGAQPKATDQVKVHYRGTLVDGTEFDSSFSRNEPTTFPVGGVIPGWQEAVQKMKVGSKWQVFIPPHLAYGERPPGNVIGPNATLIFEMELLEIL